MSIQEAARHIAEELPGLARDLEESDCLPINTLASMFEKLSGLDMLLEAVDTLLLNAETIPDPRMAGSTDACIVPFMDLDKVQELVEEMRCQTG